MDVNSPFHEQDLNDEEKEEEAASSAFVDKKVLRMMEMMGYRSGLGLGKNKQGMTEPVRVEAQFQRRGLGLKIENLGEKWDFSLDNATSVERVEWLQNTENQQFDAKTVATWPKEDKPLACIDDEHNFCDENMLRDVVAAKDIFDHLDLKELCQARTRANPFETIRSVFFMNRAALKMANIDAATDFMFTTVDQDPLHKDDPGPYYFADVCAGPGGFSEYVLWRKKWTFKGFGFTLRGEHDFKLTDSVCASPVTFLPLYGAHGDGNVCCPENIDDFTEKVLFETEKGVHFMMSDGGFSVEGNENMQEVLSKNIYICQCLIALEILRKHGHFVTKVFDVFTCFSVGLLYLMYNCFENVCILKPNSSRPANSERYVICRRYKGREDVENIRVYLRKLVDRLWELRNDGDLDIVEIVPLSLLKSDHNFYSYISKSINGIAKNQTTSLQKLATFCKNPSLVEDRQEELRKSCLEYWNIPDKRKTPLSKYSVEDLLSETVHNGEMLSVPPREVCHNAEFADFLENLQNWRYTFMQCRRNTNICNFYAGVGLSKVCRLQGEKWVKVKNLQLIRGTLLYGELVREKYVSKNSDGQLQHKYSLHVIDALRLGDLDLSSYNFEERNDLIRIYCKSVNHEFRTSTIRIRPKRIEKLEAISSNLPQSNESAENFITRLPVLGYNVQEEFYEVNSVLLLKVDKDESFHSTYILRIHLFVSKNDGESEQNSPLQALIDVVTNRSKN